MSNELQQEVGEAFAALQTALNLVWAQEAVVTSMRAAGLNTKAAGAS